MWCVHVVYIIMWCDCVFGVLCVYMRLQACSVVLCMFVCLCVCVCMGVCVCLRVGVCAHVGVFLVKPGMIEICCWCKELDHSQ